MIKAIIFDIDGVLIDSFEANLKFFQNIFRSVGYKIPTRKDYKKAFHLTMFNTLNLFARTNDLKIQKRLHNIAVHSRGSMYPVNMIKVTKNSSRIIKQLSKKYKVALVTSRVKRGVEDYLKLSGTKKCFKTIVHHSHFNYPKPNPESLLIAANRLKIKPQEAVYIGDSLTDIQAAKACGMKMILYPKKNFKGADFKTSKFQDLPKLIEKLNII